MLQTKISFSREPLVGINSQYQDINEVKVKSKYFKSGIYQ